MRDPSYKPPGSRIVTIPVSPELHRKIRIRAAELDISVKELGTRALEEIVK